MSYKTHVKKYKNNGRGFFCLKLFGVKVDHNPKMFYSFKKFLKIIKLLEDKARNKDDLKALE